MQRRTDNREYSKWRRDTLTRTTVDLIKLSTQRSKYSSVYVHEFSSHKRFKNFDDQSGFNFSVSSLLATVAICEAEQLYKEAQEILSLHQKCEESIRQFISNNSIQNSPTRADEVGKVLGYINKIEILHKSLIAETKKAMQ